MFFVNALLCDTFVNLELCGTASTCYLELHSMGVRINVRKYFNNKTVDRYNSFTGGLLLQSHTIQELIGGHPAHKYQLQILAVKKEKPGKVL